MLLMWQSEQLSPGFRGCVEQCNLWLDADRIKTQGGTWWAARMPRSRSNSVVLVRTGVEAVIRISFGNGCQPDVLWFVPLSENLIAPDSLQKVSTITTTKMSTLCPIRS